jgi:hypothetical protein
MWGPLQATELLKRHALAKKRRLDAIFHGNCTPGDDDDMAEVAEHGQKLRQKRPQVLRNYPRGDPHRDLPVGTRVFLDRSLRGNDPLIQQGISQLRWRQVDDRVMAQVLVVSDPACPGQKNAFVAALGGRLLLSTDFLTGRNGDGVAIRYERALRLPRYLWVSPSCEAQFAAALQVIRRLSTSMDRR